MVLQDTDRKRTIWKIKLYKEEFDKINNIIKKIEEEYAVEYSSGSFSKAVYKYLDERKITPYQMLLFTKALMGETKYKVSPFQMELGNVYYFTYNPKDKSVEYYDRTPCIVYIGMSRKNANYFYGLNLNYLSPRLRNEFVSRLPFLSNEYFMKKILEEEKKYKNRNIPLKRMNTGLGYREAKILYKNEYKYIIKKYSMSNIVTSPSLIHFRIVKLATMFDLYHFNKKNPYPIWNRIFDSIQKEGSI